MLEVLLDKYADTVICEMEKTAVLKLDPFLKMGKPSKIAGFFGGKDEYLKAVRETDEEETYAAIISYAHPLCGGSC